MEYDISWGNAGTSNLAINNVDLKNAQHMCDPGHGADCGEVCSCVIGHRCHHLPGDCNPCTPGLYDQGCANQCMCNQAGFELCPHKDGRHFCKGDWFGRTCDMECPFVYINNTYYTEPITASILTIATIAVILVVIYYRRRMRVMKKDLKNRPVYYSDRSSVDSSRAHDLIIRDSDPLNTCIECIASVNNLRNYHITNDDPKKLLSEFSSHTHDCIIRSCVLHNPETDKKIYDLDVGPELKGKISANRVLKPLISFLIWYFPFVIAFGLGSYIMLHDESASNQHGTDKIDKNALFNKILAFTGQDT